MPTINCHACGKEFFAKPYLVREGQRRFCSRECSQAFNGPPKPPASKPLVERFWSKVAIADDSDPGRCWEWQASRMRFGHGVFNNEHRAAHRTAYVLTCGPIPPGLCVLHHCDNPPCVRPSHLFLGTRVDNIRDMYSKRREARVSRPGEQNSNAKRTAEFVNQVRALFDSGEFTQADLSRQFGVDRRVIHDIVSGKRWRHLLCRADAKARAEGGVTDGR